MTKDAKKGTDIFGISFCLNFMTIDHCKCSKFKYQGINNLQCERQNKGHLQNVYKMHQFACNWHLSKSN